ncbi:LOW QUALITY PROTEIN: ribose operon repressor [Geomicrobium sp. JCM 19039]|nr:LOW QUALITY PROTEIN: ribose operon repressor [Geomicrobium sp. JCM 19039]
MNKPSIRDVAQKADVSTATVSHVINGTRYVAETTATRVQLAMETLGYIPNHAAKTLRSQKTSTIGIIVPDLANHFFTSVVKGIEDVLEKAGYQLLVGNTNERVDVEIQKLQAFTSQQVSGLIVATSALDVKDIQVYLPEDVPIVFIDRVPKGMDQPSVTVANEEGAFSAVSELLSTGHKHIGMITGLNQLSTTVERTSGYKRALQEAKLPYNPALVKSGDSHVQGGYNACKHLFETEQITALFVANNLMCIGAITYLKEQNIHIPREVAVIGFDDYEWANITAPPLSVVHQPVFDIGVRASEKLLAQINEQPIENRHELLETSLILRSSHNKNDESEWSTC